MVTLKEREAVEYLKRAAGCIKEQDNVVPLQLLRKMLEIEEAFIERRVFAGEKDMANVVIDATGFPELAQWCTDLGCAFGEYALIKSARRKSVLPLIQQYIDARPAGIFEEGAKIAASIKGEEALVKALSVDYDLERFLKQLKESGVLYKDPQWPGLLFSKNKSSTPLSASREYPIHLPHGSIDWESFVQFDDQHKAGVKYVDIEGAVDQKSAKKLFREPAVIYVVFAEGLRKVTLLEKQSSEGGRISMDSCDGQIKDIDRGRDYDCRSQKLNFNDTEADHHIKLVRHLHAGCFKGLCDADFSTLEPRETGIFLNMLPELNEHLQRLSALLKRYAISFLPEEPFFDFDRANRYLGIQYEKILNRMPTDDLRITYQLMVAEVAKGIRDEIEVLEKPKTSTLAKVEAKPQKRAWWKFQ